MIRFLEADVLEWASHYEGEPFHALICDPPYEMNFMGSAWDRRGISFQAGTWAALARHLLPGALGLVFAGARTFHRIACALEDAGLILHPSLFGWCYAQGWPKATRIDTQVDEQEGKTHEREVIGERLFWGHNAGSGAGSFTKNHYEGQTGEIHYEPVTAPATDLAQAWSGHRYGRQALSPALEPILIFQKPYGGKPLETMLETGAGAYWIEGARIPGLPHHNDAGRPSSPRSWTGQGEPSTTPPSGRWPSHFCLVHHPDCRLIGRGRVKSISHPTDGRSPSRLARSVYQDTRERLPHPGFADSEGYETVMVWDCHDDCPSHHLDEQSGPSETRRIETPSEAPGGNTWGGTMQTHRGPRGHTDAGGASRFFFQADWSYEIREGLDLADPVFYQGKATAKERDAGLMGKIPCPECGELVSPVHPDGRGHPQKCRRNSHPTMKPLGLTRWLAILLLPPARYAPRRLLVPFAGVASEIIGGLLAGWEEIVGIEIEPDYVRIGNTRLVWWEEFHHLGQDDPEVILRQPRVAIEQLPLF